MSGVIIGVDDSETSLRAARRAVAIAEALDEPLHLVMAVKRGTSHVVKQGGDQFIDDWVENATQTLHSIKDQIGAANATTSLGGKDPAKSICEEAEERGASMIVVGNRRVQGATRVLGTIATDVLRHAGCDVFVVQTSSD